MKNYLTTGLLFTMLAASANAVGQTHSRETALTPGPFRFITGARLGTPVTFENEIDVHSCLPLFVHGKTVAWITRAYEVKERLFVRRCERSDSTELVATGNEAGGANDNWERALVDARGRVRFFTLRLPGWSFMANPTFCDAYVAYWGFSGAAHNLTPSIYNLVSKTAVASRVLGPVNLETDDESYMGEPVWDHSCSKVSFDARVANKTKLELRVRR